MKEKQALTESIIQLIVGKLNESGEQPKSVTKAVKKSAGKLAKKLSGIYKKIDKKLKKAEKKAKGSKKNNIIPKPVVGAEIPVLN